VLTSSTVACRQALRLFSGALFVRKVGYAYKVGAIPFVELFALPLLTDETERDYEREVGTC
jgi:hypothetical protein